MPPEQPYPDSADHLRDHLRRVELLVRAQVERWRTALADARPDTRWGTGVLDDRELQRYLSHPFTEPMDDDERTPPTAQAYVLQAGLLAVRIAARRHARLRVERLRDAFALSQTDLDVILLCLLAELDGRYRRLYAYLADEEWRKAPTVGLLAEILRPGAAGLPAFRRRFAPDGPLLRHRLVSLADGPETGLAGRSVLLDSRIAAFLGGEDYLDGPVRLGEPLPRADLILTAEREAVLTGLLDRCAVGPAGITIALLGAPGSGRQAYARAMATALGVPLLVAHADPALTGPVYREARLRGAAVLWRRCARVAGLAAEEDQAWDDLLIRAGGHPQPTFVDHAQPWDPPPGAGPFVRVPCPSPGLAERRTIWTGLLAGVSWREPAPDVPALAGRLAATFLLTPGHMRQAVRMSAELAAQRDPRDPRVTAADLHEAGRRQSSRRLMSIARPAEAPPGMTLDDLVLPPAKRRELFALRDRIRDRPLAERLLGPARAAAQGLVVMFTGPSGTGKTAAATLIAQDLGRDLLRVDLSQVVSKWVGETEKNLDRALTEAQDAHAILFFDEAEAIFGKRGTVTDAHDRYAAQEISFLLQRIEEYPGVVILATNLRQNLDEAFTRRIKVVIEFQRPDDESRLRVWKLALTGVSHDLTDEEIAKAAENHRLSAAAIMEAVTAASFVALSRDPEAARLTAEDVDEAVRAELHRLGLPPSPGLRF